MGERGENHLQGSRIKERKEPKKYEK